jgi:predicted dehydrogenase/threonine dehydrogenase-like Zn-dependent dehydrogenase
MQILLGDMQTGEVGMHDIPAPELRPGGILVRTAFSAVSTGTELAQLETASKSLLGKAAARPDVVRQVLEYARVHGLRAAYNKVRSRLETLLPIGYSCSGTVMAVGAGVSGFSCGDRVACAGVGYARHAEINWIPQNLAAHVPEGVSMEAAALSTVGAIALQGFRQSGAVLGETVAVIGAGLVGALTVQLAHSAGCRVVAIDSDSDRAHQSVSLGANLGLPLGQPNLEDEIKRFSRYGVDVAIIAAETPSSEPLELAARILRDRGRIVIVGTIGINVPRAALYAKEISVVMSRSYGPGRYDPRYEEAGNDYPIGYVRWTEKRNMEAFLDLLSSGSLETSALLSKRFQLGQAEEAFAELRSSRYYTVVLDYGQASSAADLPKPQLVPSRANSDVLRVGCIGAGNFAREHILPHLRRQPGIELHSVASASGISAEAAKKNFRFREVRSPGDLLQDPSLDFVFILSRHQTHAAAVVQALRLRKGVFVEKPLAVNRQELDQVKLAHRQAQNPFLMVGFNRRFAPATIKLRELFMDRTEPMFVNIRVNAGYLPQDHWTQAPQDGGRVIGEMCHFVDWGRFVIGHPIRSVSVASLPDVDRYNGDNLAATIAFSDGSIANLVYLANGSPALPKEHYEVFCQGKVARLDDFCSLEFYQQKSRRRRFAQDKGHQAELACVLEAMRAGRESPIPFNEIIEVTEATFQVYDMVCRGDGAARETELAAVDIAAVSR